MTESKHKTALESYGRTPLPLRLGFSFPYLFALFNTIDIAKEPLVAASQLASKGWR
jgi:hypothetical protein